MDSREVLASSQRLREQARHVCRTADVIAADAQQQRIDNEQLLSRVARRARHERP